MSTEDPTSDEKTTDPDGWLEESARAAIERWGSRGFTANDIVRELEAEHADDMQAAFMDKVRATAETVLAKMAPAGLRAEGDATYGGVQYKHYREEPVVFRPAWPVCPDGSPNVKGVVGGNNPYFLSAPFPAWFVCRRHKIAAVYLMPYFRTTEEVVADMLSLLRAGDAPFESGVEDFAVWRWDACLDAALCYFRSGADEDEDEDEDEDTDEGWKVVWIDRNRAPALEYESPKWWPPRGWPTREQWVSDGAGQIIIRPGGPA
jgi:hypothetical protein